MNQVPQAHQVLYFPSASHMFLRIAPCSWPLLFCIGEPAAPSVLWGVFQADETGAATRRSSTWIEEAVVRVAPFQKRIVRTIETKYPDTEKTYSYGGKLFTAKLDNIEAFYGLNSFRILNFSEKLSSFDVTFSTEPPTPPVRFGWLRSLTWNPEHNVCIALAPCDKMIGWYIWHLVTRPASRCFIHMHFYTVRSDDDCERTVSCFADFSPDGSR